MIILFKILTFATNIKPMKKTLYFFASVMMLIALNANAQNQRTLLFECFTNTGCGPCAQQNPALDALINANGDRIAAIKYHVNWPAGNDPMYLHNTADNNARRGVYNIGSVPTTVVDGIRFKDIPSRLNQGKVNNWLAIESPFEMRMTHELNATQDTITVHVMGRASAAVEGTLKLYVGVIEKEIHYPTAPGSNGERDFYSVMKKLLPSSAGTTIGTDIQAGGYFAYNFSWALANVIDNNQLSAVAWIQNPSSKEVFQACKSTDTMEPYFDNEGSLTQIENVKTTNCSGVASPTVLITNFGNNPVTSATIEAFVNGVSVKTITWNGNLSTFESTRADIGEIEFPVQLENDLQIRIVDLNGNPDEAPDNDVASFKINGTPDIAGKTLKLTLRTDKNPEQTTWQIVSLTTGEVILEGGPYEEENTMHNITLELGNDDCYGFTIYDSGGDGLTDGTGLYGLSAGNITLFSGREFGYSESHEFYYEDYDGTVETQKENILFPNPTQGVVNIMLPGEHMVSVFNMVGQCMLQTPMKDNARIDLSAFGKGVFFVKIDEKSQKILIK